jgi:hypothetical protein
MQHIERVVIGNWYAAETSGRLVVKQGSLTLGGVDLFSGRQK